MPSYLRAESLPEALAGLAAGARALAGGTDLWAATEAQSLGGDIVDITRIGALRGISETEAGLRIGAATPWAEIARHPGPPAWPALAEAAREVGGRQVQTAGTLGGNLCNASPAADGVPALLVLDASVELVSAASGARRLPLGDFLTGPRRTARRADELLTAVHLPAAALGGRSRFLKLGARAHLVISIVMVAARVEVSGRRIQRAALAVGACGPTARRIGALEAALAGLTPDEAAARITATSLAAVLTPIDDHRASAAYRLEAAAELCRRALTEAAG